MSCAPPFHTGFWGFIYDWQTLIAGFLAIGAAIIGAIAVYYVGNAQMAAVRKRDRLQAKSLAVAILPEILQLRVHHDRAMDIVHQEFPKLHDTDLNTNVAYRINMATIELPPVLSQSVDRLYLLEEAG
jgi:F0F1-type ATP synthase membrane subunit c/vacuolar-type H+-ATPase subunit K